MTTDVNHSFWVPDFLSKRDLIPGVDNEIDVTPTEAGTFDGRCAEFCGLDHWRMNFTVRVVPPGRVSSAGWPSQRDGRRRDRRSTTARAPSDDPSTRSRGGDRGCSRWLTTTDHKRIGISLHGHRVRLLPARRGARRGHPGPAVQPREPPVVETGTYNQVFTMHGSIMMFLFLGAVRLRPGQLPRAAADRRPGHGVPPAQRPRLLAATCSAASRWSPASSPPTAPPTSAGPATRRCRRRSASPASAATCGSLGARAHRPVRRAHRGQHRRHGRHHAGPGHDDVPDADLHLEHARDERARADRLPGADRGGGDAVRRPAPRRPRLRRRPAAARRSCGSTCSGSSATPRCTSSSCRSSA